MNMLKFIHKIYGLPPFVKSNCKKLSACGGKVNRLLSEPSCWIDPHAALNEGKPCAADKKELKSPIEPAYKTEKMLCNLWRKSERRAPVS